MCNGLNMYKKVSELYSKNKR